MRIRKNLIKLGFVFAGYFSLINITYAAYPISITSITKFPSQLESGVLATATYSISDNSPLFLSPPSFPPGVVQTNADCKGGVKPNTTCTVNLTYTAPAGITKETQGPLGGPWVSAGATKIQPKESDKINIEIIPLQPTSVLVNNGKKMTVIEFPDATTAFPLKVVGNEPWRSPNVTFTPTAGSFSNGVNFTTTCGGPADIPSGGTCSASFTYFNTAKNEELLGTLTVKGFDLATKTYNVYLGGEVSVTEDTANAHLVYKKLIVTNKTPDPLKIDEVSSSIPNDISICGTGGGYDTKCFSLYNSTCANKTLAPNETCSVWIRAKKDSNIPITNRNVPGVVTIKATALVAQNNPQIIHKVNVLYNQDLYVGGYFEKTADGTVTLNNIARWDGSSWNPLGPVSEPGLYDFVYAETTYAGDLYLAGGFTGAEDGTPMNYVGRWDGNQWHFLGSNVANQGVDSYVTSFATLNEKLYFGGFFTNTNGGGMELNYIASWGWDGAQWSFSPLMPSTTNASPGLDNDVLALTTFGDKLCAGGFFENTKDGDPLNYIGCWTGSGWQVLGNDADPGLDDYVNALTSWNGKLYIGGAFQNTHDVGKPLKRIASWASNTNGGVWSEVGDASIPGAGVDNEVVNFTSFDGKLYFAGAFVNAFGVSPTVLNGVGAWDGSVLSSLGTPPGFLTPTDVEAITNVAGRLYAGGIFTQTAVPKTVDEIAVFNSVTTAWDSLSGGGLGPASGHSFGSVDALEGVASVTIAST